jgi:hypothetical protein
VTTTLARAVIKSGYLATDGPRAEDHEVMDLGTALVVLLIGLIVQYFVIKYAVADGLRMTLRFLAGESRSPGAAAARRYFTTIVNSLANDWSDER